MGYMDKQPWRMQGKWFFRSRVERVAIFGWDLEFSKKQFLGVAQGAGSQALAPIHLHLKVRRRRFNVHLTWVPLRRWNKGHFTHETENLWPLHFKHSHWWKRRSRSHYAWHYAWGTNEVCECKMDVKIYVDSYMIANGSCFMITWIIFKNHLLEVGLTQNRETMALRMLTTVDLIYFIMSEDPHE